MKILVFGTTGMLGYQIFKFFSSQSTHDIFGTVRYQKNDIFLKNFHAFKDDGKIIFDFDISSFESVVSLLSELKPDLIINSIAYTNKNNESNDFFNAALVNSVFPKKLSELCFDLKIRMIHFSSDAIFNGSKGPYFEKDPPDFLDLYGLTKYLGEISNNELVVTIRTSIIGHVIPKTNTKNIVNWFLNESEQVKGFSNYVFSGLTTLEVSKILNDYIIPNEQLYGIYQVSSKPISKFDLLKLISSSYGKKIGIIPDNLVKINRSLDSSRFSQITGYRAPEWSVLINEMRNDSLT
jgi:dTDP-4-dehydrorhamnose reductase